MSHTAALPTEWESLQSETEGGTNKRSKDRSSLWLQEETSYHESISTSQAALTQQCEHAITAAKQKSGNSCSSVSSPKWGQHTVNSQTSVGTGQRQTRRVCVCISVSLRVPACEARIGKKQLGSSSQARQENSCLREEGRQREGGGSGGLSVEHAQRLSWAV